MCCEFVEYTKSMAAKKAEIVAEVVPSLKALDEGYPDTYLLAMREILGAVEKDSFNNHSPADPNVWNVMAWPIRTRVEFDDERLYMLVSLLNTIVPAVTNALEEKFCTRMLAKKLPVSA